MQDSAAEINLNEDLVRSRRWRQLKLIVLQEEQAPGAAAPRPLCPCAPPSAPGAPRAAVQWTTTPHSQDLPLSTAIYSSRQFRTIYM